MFNIRDKIGQWADAAWSKTARVESVNELPPAADGRTFRYEVIMRLSKDLAETPTESELREFADGLLDEIAELDDTEAPDEWDGPDELYIQFYAAGRDTDAGACGTVHWVEGDGYENVESRPYFF